MTDEQRARAISEELQSARHAADRPRLRALELASYDAPGYWGRQPTNPLGIWTLNGGPGISDGSIK